MNQGTGAGWQRLDPKVMLIDPVKAARQFLVPALVAFVGIGSSQSGMPWWLVPVFVVGALVFGVLPWATTSYRLTERQFEQRTGWLNRRTLTASVDRIRSVDLESSVLHRLMGLTKVEIGTGVDDSRITLDALSRASADELRQRLLARAPLPVEVADDDTPAPAAPVPEQELARLDWSWVRFAPLSLSRLAVVAGALGALSQFLDDVPTALGDAATGAWDALATLVLPLAVALVTVVLAGAWVVGSMIGYAVQWGQLRLVRDAGAVRLTAGLLTTRSTTIEESRIRGVELTEPVLMRPFGGAELQVLATGVESGTTRVLPPSPRAVDLEVGAGLLGDPSPLTTTLRRHGRFARRRAHVQAQILTGVATAAAGALVGLAMSLDLPEELETLAPWWLPLAVLAVLGSLGVLTAEATYRHLGHALTAAHLVSGHGALTRIRTVLETDGIIGWVVRQSLFQRRVGLATLVATTAAGAEQVTVTDVPLPVAVALADAATPGLLTPWAS